MRALLECGADQASVPALTRRPQPASPLNTGVGENGSMLRELALSNLEWAGVAVDRAANAAAVRGHSGEVQAPGSRIKVRLDAEAVGVPASRVRTGAPRRRCRRSWRSWLSPCSDTCAACMQVLVIPTDEQLEIARETVAVARRAAPHPVPARAA